MDELVIVDVEQGSPEWHALRKTKRTASNTAGVMGTSKWADPLSVFEHYTNAEKAFKGNQATDYGTRTEPRARACLELAHDTEGRPVVGYRGEYLASLDFLTPDGSWNVDIKSPFAGKDSSTWKAAEQGLIEPGYADQLEHQHRVFGTERNGLFVYINDQTHLYVPYTPNDQRWGEIQRAWDHFWETYIVKGVPPNVFHERTDEALVQLGKEWVAVKSALKAHEEMLATIEKDIKAAAGGDKIVVPGLIKVNTFAVQGSIDHEAIWKSLKPDLNPEPWRKPPSQRTVIGPIEQPKKPRTKKEAA